MQSLYRGGRIRGIGYSSQQINLCVSPGIVSEGREPLLLLARFATSLRHREIMELSHETRSRQRLYCFRVLEEDGLAIDRVDGGMP